jgi:hypothetical protein
METLDFEIGKFHFGLMSYESPQIRHFVTGLTLASKVRDFFIIIDLIKSGKITFYVIARN